MSLSIIPPFSETLKYFETLFIAVCVVVGYIIGKQIQKDKTFIKNILDKILPPGSYR